MKNLMIALSSTFILSLSTSVMADANVGIIDSEITQIQVGSDQEQDAIIGLVTNDYKGDANIFVSGSYILQTQANDNNKQTAQIGVVGCDC